VIISRVAALLVLWIPAAWLYHLLMLHDIHRKLEMSGDEIRTYYSRMAHYLTSPITTSVLAIANLLLVIFFYEILAFVIQTVLQRLFKNSGETVAK